MRRGHALDTVLTLALFGLFAGCLLMVLLLGARSYQGVLTHMEEGYDARTCLQYIGTKVNHYSGTDAVTVTQFGDGSALALYETIDGCSYVTYLYCHDGALTELFCETDVALEPSAGFAILDIQDFTATLVQDNLLYLTCTGEGITAQLYVGLQLGEGAAA